MVPPPADAKNGGGIRTKSITLSPEQRKAMASIQYPNTRKGDQKDTYFGTTVADPYRWLEDDHSAETAAWVEAQNAVTNAYLAELPARSMLKSRLEKLINFPRYSGAFQKAGLIFFYQNDGLQDQSVLYIQRGLDAAPEVLLDPNQPATLTGANQSEKRAIREGNPAEEKAKYAEMAAAQAAQGPVQLRDFAVADDGKHAAYAISRAGSDWVEYHVIDLTTKRVLDETIRWAKFTQASWRGSTGFYYSRYPQPEPGKELTARNENAQVFFHTVGTPAEKDQLIYADPKHPDRYLSVGVTDDDRYELLYVGKPGELGNALYYRPTGKGDFKPVVAEIGRFSYNVVDNDNDALLIQTNEAAPNSRVVRYVPGKTSSVTAAQTLIAERPEAIDGISTAGGRLFVSYLKDVTTRVATFDYRGKALGDVKLPGLGTAVGFGGEATATDVFYQFTSYNYPATVLRYTLQNGVSKVFKQPTVPGFSPEALEVKQDFVKSKDGARVPVFIVHRKGLKMNGANPTILYGYGGFNVNLNPNFSALRLAWLEQGGVYVVANLRGGAEYGEKWHEAGMRLRKQNVFDDCIAVAEWLIAKNYTQPAKLALMGGSNGGLLVGAVINQRPELFGAAVPAVGVMDMLRYQNFTAGQFWEAEYGTSRDEKDFRNLYKFSPLHTIRAGQQYPAVLITTADHDDRVVPAHSFKYAATLQELAAPVRPALIRIETKSGHGASSLSKTIEETADVYAFLFHELGVTPVENLNVQLRQMSEEASPAALPAR